ncbi:MAG: 50S ribosomal protein L23 [Gammaproteobacteria bacterium RIFCSPHIGHO2_12_FULL_37_14]|nr:MAG: 50S ribosomal protein L23 [Gammaproteobacteria bacterium RIFCSPHIGHO2_12_FULL_37_14]
MNQERMYKIIESSHISEKATILTQKNNQYVFRVVQDATKIEIKTAVEFLFNTKVKSVRVVNVRLKQKTFKGTTGYRKAWKKAYVSLESNQKLNMVGA